MNSPKQSAIDELKKLCDDIRKTFFVAADAEMALFKAEEGISQAPVEECQAVQETAEFGHAIAQRRLVHFIDQYNEQLEDDDYGFPDFQFVIDDYVVSINKINKAAPEVQVNGVELFQTSTYQPNKEQE